jgi:palmitoyl-protein thioesterase
MICNLLTYVEQQLAVLQYMQDHVAPAAYYRQIQTDFYYELYLNVSSYLPYINNEKPHNKSAQYKERFSALEELMLVKFNQDRVVYPKTSEHFGEMDRQGRILDMTESQLYKEDWIGLRTLDQAGKVRTIEVDADHCIYGTPEIQSYFLPFLYPDLASSN